MQRANLRCTSAGAYLNNFYFDIDKDWQCFGCISQLTGAIVGCVPQVSTGVGIPGKKWLVTNSSDLYTNLFHEFSSVWALKKKTNFLLVHNSCFFSFPVKIRKSTNINSLIPECVANIMGLESGCNSCICWVTNSLGLDVPCDESRIPESGGPGGPGGPGEPFKNLPNREQKQK